MSTSKYIILKESKFLSIKGQDNKDFLQGIITNDINKCDKHVIYSCLLSPQGKFLSDFFVIPYRDSFLIEINQKFFSNFIDKLNLYKLRSKIEIDEIHSLKSMIIINNISEKNLEIGKIIFNNQYIKYVDPRNINLGYRIIIENNLLDNLIKSNNFKLADIKEYRKIMIKNIIPDSLNDLIVNKSLLLENNFEHINALDWNKGCYIGQENTARMKYRALLKKSIRLIKIQSGIVKSGDQIFFNEKNIGQITSIIENIGLAMIKIEEANNNKILLTTKGKIRVMN